MGSERVAAQGLAEDIIAPPEVLLLLQDGSLLHWSGPATARTLRPQPLQGLESGDRLVAIDFRIARGQLYALSEKGWVYTVALPSGQLVPLAKQPLPASIDPVGALLDFNPAVDRVRVLTAKGLNLRLHPESGQIVDADPDAPGVQIDGPIQPPDGAFQPIGLAYSYDARDSSASTAYLIDCASGRLFTLGSRAGVQPPVSPNTGMLFPVGPMGSGTCQGAGFDISDRGNLAWALLKPQGGEMALHRINLTTGQAFRNLTLPAGLPVADLAIEP